MNIYERLIENPLFFKWIYHPTKEIESYWENYLKTSPDEVEQIIEFKSQFENYFTYNDEELTDVEKRALADRIIRKLEKRDIKHTRVLFLRTVFRYAAVAVIFFMIGGSLVYLYLGNRQLDNLADNAILPGQVQQPTLIIEKQEIPLNEGKSELDYSNEDKIVLDKGKTIKKERQAPVINTLVIPYGNRSVVTLSDGSTVWLNAGSRLVYPSEFVDKTREVFLVGEAFFEVQKNESQPFVVKTADVKVSVLGTRFNVSAYPEDYSVQTVLAEGSVKINRTNANLFEKGIELVPGQMAYYNKKNRDTRIINVEVDNYTLWTQGLFKFSNTDLNRITKRLERYYNLTFEYEDPLSGTIQITGKLDVTQEMNEVFEYLSTLTGLEFIKVNGKQYLIR